MRYEVARYSDVRDEVSADYFEIRDSGALVFYAVDGALVVAYGPGKWLTLTPVPESD